MSTSFTPRFSTSAIGSLPFTDAAQAVQFVAEAGLDIPFWPQLPRRGFLEQMIPQYTEGMPGIKLDLENQSTRLDPASKYEQLTRFYEAFMTEDTAAFPISESFAAGFHAFRAVLPGKHWSAVKGQITGPVTFATGISEKGGDMLYSDADLRDAAVKLLQRKAEWQIAQLHAAGQVVIFVDEPVLSAFGSSAYLGISAADVIEVEKEILAAIRSAGGLSGMHICGNSDWSVILDTGIDILNFDAYRYGGRLALYADSVQSFLERGGCIAWGMVPTTSEDLAKETSASLAERLHACIGALVEKGIPESRVRDRSILTPCCGCGSLNIPETRQVFTILRELRALMR